MLLFFILCVIISHSFGFFVGNKITFSRLFIESKLNMHVIGLTGGICSGKSTVSKELASLGVKVIDADKVGHEAYLPDTPCYAKLVSHFGEGIVSQDRTINRPALGAIVFSDPQKMKELQDIVWPEIKEMILARLATMKDEGVEAAVVEAAIMLEASWQDVVSTVWVTFVDPETALKRLMKRNNFSTEEAMKRINSQMPNEERIKRADVVIENNDDMTPERLKETVDQLYHSFIESKKSV